MSAEEIEVREGFRKHYAVAVYAISRVYGGPEEGGWWYDDGPLMGVQHVTASYDVALEVCQRLNEQYKKDAEAENYRDGVRDVATLVELPRKESIYADVKCHAEIDEDEYRTRWDIPTEYEERHMHYC